MYSRNLIIWIHRDWTQIQIAKYICRSTIINAPCCNFAQIYQDQLIVPLWVWTEIRILKFPVQRYLDNQVSASALGGTAGWYYVCVLHRGISAQTHQSSWQTSFTVCLQEQVNQQVSHLASLVWQFAYERTYSGLGKLIGNGLQNCLTQNSPLSWSLRWASPI